MSVPKMLDATATHPSTLADAMADQQSFFDSLKLDISKIIKSKSEHTQAYLKSKKKSGGAEKVDWECPIPLKDFAFYQSRVQYESLLCIGLFCHKLPDCANFISSYLREVAMLLLHRGKDKVSVEELNVAV